MKKIVMGTGTARPSPSVRVAAFVWALLAAFSQSNGYAQSASGDTGNEVVVLTSHAYASRYQALQSDLVVVFGPRLVSAQRSLALQSMAEWNTTVGIDDSALGRVASIAGNDATIVHLHGVALEGVWQVRVAVVVRGELVARVTDESEVVETILELTSRRDAARQPDFAASSPSALIPASTPAENEPVGRPPQVTSGQLQLQSRRLELERQMPSLASSVTLVVASSIMLIAGAVFWAISSPVSRGVDDQPFFGDGCYSDCVWSDGMGWGVGYLVLGGVTLPFMILGLVKDLKKARDLRRQIQEIDREVRLGRGLSFGATVRSGEAALWAALRF